MPIRNQNWYDLQEGRRYPLDERSTGIDDAGHPIRDNIIVDCHIKFPEEYGSYPYIAGLTVTANLVAAIVAVADNLNNIKILAAVTVTKPMLTAKNYPLTPLLDGVAGWIAFGGGVAENFSGKYSTSIQTLIAPRNARAYRRMPVTSIGKYGLPDALQNIVKIEGIAPLTATYKTVEIDGKPARAVVLALQGQFDDTDEQPLREFLGPCGKRPESGTCDKPPILTVNGIKPDCNGNLTIAVGDGLSTYMFEDCGGMGVDTPIGLGEFCPKEEINPDCTRSTGEPVGRGTDLCVPAASSSSASSDSSATSSSSNSSDSSESSESSSSSSSESCLALPYSKNLTNPLDSELETNFGIFSAETAINPPYVNINSSSSSGGAQAYFPVIRASSVTGFNVLTVKNCATDWAINQKISATLKLGGGSRRNGGVVVNYLTPAQTGNYRTFFAALLDLDQNKFRLIRFNGTNTVNEFSVDFSAANFIFNPDNWYTISVTPTLFNSSIILTCGLSVAGAGSTAMGFSVTTNNYGLVAGRAGVMSNQAYTYFSNIKIGE